MIELAALDAAEQPDWQAAVSYIDALVLEELEDDLVEMCGVDTDTEPRERWLELVRARLRTDLERFRGDVEAAHGQIERWELGSLRIFSSVGRWEDEGDPEEAHGWMCRLLDSGALSAAGFERVRKAEL